MQNSALIMNGLVTFKMAKIFFDRKIIKLERMEWKKLHSSRAGRMLVQRTSN